MKRAFLFPGQGAQIIGMGKDICEKYKEAEEIYNKASEMSGIDIKKICFEGPEEILNQTQYTQLAILTTSLAILEVLKKNGITADVAVGLSLGEYTALEYAGILSFEDTIKLVQKRGYYMQKMLPKDEYVMAAVIGLDSAKIEEICEKIQKEGKFVTPANYNCSTQTVISGEQKAIDEAIEKLKQEGARKVIPLKTSGPFHTKKLEKAKEEYRKELENITFNKIENVKVIKNIDGKYYQDEDDKKEILANHIVSPVKFAQAIELMKQEGIEEYIEIGPGKTLTGFVKKDGAEGTFINVSSLEQLEEIL